MMGCTTAEAAIECPAYHNGKKLIGAELSEGPPSEEWVIMPVNGAWDIDYIPKSGRMFYLACEYGKTREVLPVILPREIKRCEYVAKARVICK
jgi:hypothetical protein